MLLIMVSVDTSSELSHAEVLTKVNEVELTTITAVAETDPRMR